MSRSRRKYAEGKAEQSPESMLNFDFKSHSNLGDESMNEYGDSMEGLSGLVSGISLYLSDALTETIAAFLNAPSEESLTELASSARRVYLFSKNLEMQGITSQLRTAIEQFVDSLPA